MKEDLDNRSHDIISEILNIQTTETRRGDPKHPCTG